MTKKKKKGNTDLNELLVLFNVLFVIVVFTSVTLTFNLGSRIDHGQNTTTLVVGH